MLNCSSGNRNSTLEQKSSCRERKPVVEKEILILQNQGHIMERHVPPLCNGRAHNEEKLVTIINIIT